MTSLFKLQILLERDSDLRTFSAKPSKSMVLIRAHTPPLCSGIMPGGGQRGRQGTQPRLLLQQTSAGLTLGRTIVCVVLEYRWWRDGSMRSRRSMWLKIWFLSPPSISISMTTGAIFIIHYWWTHFTKQGVKCVLELIFLMARFERRGTGIDHCHHQQPIRLSLKHAVLGQRL